VSVLPAHVQNARQLQQHIRASDISARTLVLVFEECRTDQLIEEGSMGLSELFNAVGRGEGAGEGLALRLDGVCFDVARDSRDHVVDFL